MHTTRFIFLFLLFLFGCESSYSSSYTPLEFVIIHSSNIRGEAEPCGWPKNPLGGLARKATIIDKAKQEGKPVLVFDSGDIFFLDSTKYNHETRKVHAEIIAKSHNLMNCNSLTPGHRDVSEFGLQYLKSLKICQVLILFQAIFMISKLMRESLMSSI